MIVALIVVMSALVVYAWIAFWQPRAFLRLVASRFPGVLYYVPTHERVVALTIDDGPDPTSTPAILDSLQRHAARATFFTIGTRAAGHRALLDRIRSGGHEVANHCWTDSPSVFLTPARFERELLMVESCAGIAHEPKWFRPGFGWFSRRMLAQLAAHGYRCCLGSVYPHDTKLRSAALISRYVRARVFPGAIIVLHDGQPDRIRTAEALDRLLPALIRRGYDVVTVSELVARAGHRPRGAAASVSRPARAPRH